MLLDAFIDLRAPRKDRCRFHRAIGEFYFAILARKAAKAEQYMRLFLRAQGGWNRVCRVEAGAPMAYTKLRELQRAFNDGYRFVAADREKLAPLKARNRELVHWCLLLGGGRSSSGAPRLRPRRA